MESENDRLKRVLATNSPYYQQQDLQPLEGGRSLLHDGSGRALHKPPAEVRQQNVATGHVSEPPRVKIKATQPAVPHPQAPLKYRELNPTHTAQDPSPPQQAPVMDEVPDNGAHLENPGAVLSDMPVHVGNHEEHSWHDHHVTGAPVDNSDYVNAEALQGSQRLPQTQEEQQQLERQQAEASWSEENPPRPVIHDVISKLTEGEMVVIVKGDPVFVRRLCYQ